MREHAPNRSIGAIAWTLMLLLALSPLGGCKRKSNSTAAKRATETADTPAPIVTSLEEADFFATPKTPQEALERMVQAYRTATSYHDQAVAVLAYSQDGAPQIEEEPVAVAFHRPSDSLAVEAYQVRMQCQGGELKARIVDEATRDFDHQVVRAPVSTPISMATLQPFPMLTAMLDQGMVRTPIQLELLLSDQPLTYFRGEQMVKRMLERETVLGRSCLGVAVGEDDQQFVFWIDAESGLLRQLDFPTAAMQQATLAKDLRLSVQFRKAMLTHDPNRFEWSEPEAATVVKFFVPPPQPLPTGLYSKVPPPFGFDGAAGAADQTSLKGKMAVLVWFSQHPTCRATLQQLTQVRQRWSRDDVAIAAVCTESEQVSDGEIAALLQQWGVDLPLGSVDAPFVRDLQAVGRDVFTLPSVPTTVALDAEGRLHVFDVGYNPNLAPELDLVLRMLKDGKDVGRQVLERAENERAAYHQDLVAVGAKGIRVEFPVKPRRDPEQLKVTRKWSVSAIKHPGNILVQPAGDSHTLAVLDGLRTVAILDAGGELLENTELDLPAGVGVSWLKAARSGKMYVASTPGADQLFVFDRRWQRLASYPEEPLHDGLLDAVVLPREDEELAMAIGVRGAGLQRIDTLEAATIQRTWSNRECGSPLSVDLVETGEGWRLLVADPTGMFYIFSTDGRRIGGPLRPGNWPLYSIHAGRFPHAPGAVLCGLTFDALGQRIAVGFDLSLQEQWKLELGGGSFASPLESVASGELMGSACWVLASPDGVLDIIRADGQLRDQFHYGAMIRGLAILPDQTLLIATADAVECWELGRKP